MALAGRASEQVLYYIYIHTYIHTYTLTYILTLFFSPPHAFY